MHNDELLDDFIWVTLASPEDFLKVKETLQRIGVASRKDKRLFQSAHVLHKQGKYAIVHFKQLFALDGKETNFSEEDRGRLNTIASLLAEWGLVKIVNPDKIVSPRAPMSQIKVLSFKEKGEWELCSKYSIGRTRKPPEKMDNYE